MAAKNLKDELRKLDEEEARIREQRTKLREEAKTQALAAVNDALAELNALGYNYRLVEGVASTTSRSAPSSGGKRRTGIRDQVLAVVAEASPDGIAPAGIRDKLGVTDKSGTQAVANALSALKRTGKISDKDGAYIAA